MELEDADAAIRESTRKLYAWSWVSTISDHPDDAIAVLREEAIRLIDLGRRHPTKAVTIGKLVVGYHRLMVKIASSDTVTAAA